MVAIRGAHVSGGAPSRCVTAEDVPANSMNGCVRSSSGTRSAASASRSSSREAPKVGIYTCGPTVYARIHVGNARPYVIPMLLRRFLAREGYDPTLVINLTDINDKIYDAAREAGVPSAEFAERMTADYVEDTDRLGIGRPDAEPKATDDDRRDHRADPGR